MKEGHDECLMGTHVDDDSLTEVVVVWDGFEVLHSSELAVRGRPVLVLAAEFRQRPATQDNVTSHTDMCQQLICHRPLRRLHGKNMKTKAAGSSEMLIVIDRTPRRHISVTAARTSNLANYKGL